VAREALLGGKAWQSVSLMVLREATGKATAGSRAIPSEPTLSRALLQFARVAPVVPDGVDHDALGFELVVEGEWETAHPSPAGSLIHGRVKLGCALHLCETGLDRAQELVSETWRLALVPAASGADVLFGLRLEDEAARHSSDQRRSRTCSQGITRPGSAR